MNITHYLEFPIWRMSCGGDGILEKNVYQFAISLNGVTLICLFYPAYLSLPTYKMACRKLCQPWKVWFLVADMPKAVDLMYKAFSEITKDGNLMLDDDFMMNIFEPLAKKIKPFK